MTLAQPKTQSLIFAPNVIVDEYTLSFGPSITREQAVDAGINLSHLEDSSRYWIIWWAIHMLDRRWMDAVDIAQQLPGTSVKTVHNWYAARHRFPKSASDIPHPDWHSSYYIETASLSDEKYDEAVRWIIAQEDQHGRIASIARLRKWMRGEDAYPEPPRLLKLYGTSRDDIVEQLKRKLPDDWSGEVSVTLMED